MAELSSTEAFKYLGGHGKRFHVLGAIGQRAVEPPVPFSQAEIVAELQEVGLKVHPSEVSREVNALVRLGLVDKAADQRSYKRYSPTYPEFWTAISQLMDCVETIFPSETQP